MIVYDFKGFPNPDRVRIAIAEKGLMHKVQFVTVDVPKGASRTAAFKAKVPTGTVPALELDDGTVIAECTAITEYLDHSIGEPTLTGTTPTQRGVIHMMQRRAEAGLLDAATDCFHHATPGLGPDLETDQNAPWGERQRARAIKSLHYFDSVLSNQPYVAGETFTMADITVMAALAFLPAVAIETPAECTHLLAYRARNLTRPSFAA